MVRAYFTLDLTPYTYVESVVRMVSASLFALVLSFGLEKTLSEIPGSVPLIAFAFGYFPNRALLFIEYLASKLVGWGTEKYESTPLWRLRGMSLAHEVELNREGFDNIKNLAEADTVDLAIRTGFAYRQLRHWVGEAWLRLHLADGDAYDRFVRSTALTTRHEIADYLGPMAEAERSTALDEVARQSQIPKTTLLGLVALVLDYEPHVSPPAPVAAVSTPSVVPEAVVAP